MIYALDTETGPFDPTEKKRTNAWALEPYHENFYIKFFGITGPNNYNKIISKKSNSDIKFMNDLIAEINFLHHKEVVCHNTIFDIGCLLSVLTPINLRSIKWRDTSLLVKWLVNSQDNVHDRFSLRYCISNYLMDHPEAEEFVSMKENMENSNEYWLNRLRKDCQLTAALYDHLIKLLPPEQLKGYIIECKCLLPLAIGWYKGINLDQEMCEELHITYKAHLNKKLRELYITEPVLRSPKKLSELLFKDWNLESCGYTPGGNFSTNAASLKYIALKSHDKRVVKLLEAKKDATIISKYGKGLTQLGNIMHPSPRLFNSYTGRMTYNSKIQKKYPIGIAMHQLPRKVKMVKECIIAPKRYKIFYSDFNGQELRVMAVKSKDKVMIDSFNQGKDLHSIMTETIYGTPYNEIMKLKETNEEIKNQRDNGKLTNLSAMYRIGAKSLQSKFFEQYDKIITIREANHYLNSYRRTFKGIPIYWSDAIKLVRKQGYAETFAKRRFYIDELDWQGESSAINFPIQGSGADLTELIIALVAEQFPELIVLIQVHDSISWYYPDGFDPLELKEFINIIDYEVFYNQSIPIEFPLDCAIGDNLSELEVI